MKNSAFKIALILVIAFMAGDMIHYYPLLPDRVAIHFSTGGIANGWAGKSAFLYFGFGSVIIILLVFRGIFTLLKKSPDSMINLPKKEYWLKEEQRTSTIKTLRTYIEGILVLTILFLVALMHYAYKANLMPVPKLESSFWLMFAIYFITVIAITLQLYIKFSRTPQ